MVIFYFNKQAGTCISCEDLSVCKSDKKSNKNKLHEACRHVDMPKICLRYVWDMSDIFLRYALDLPEI